MGVNTNATIQVVLSWSQIDTDNNNPAITTTDVGSHIYNKTFSSGVGNTGISRLWHKYSTLTAGGADLWDLSALPRAVFSGTFNEAFTNIKAIIVENLASGWGSYTGMPGYTGAMNHAISIYATGLGLSGIFNGGSGNLRIEPQSPMIFVNRVSGWIVSSTQKLLTVKDVEGSGCAYRIGIIGV